MACPPGYTLGGPSTDPYLVGGPPTDSSPSMALDPFTAADQEAADDDLQAQVEALRLQMTQLALQLEQQRSQRPPTDTRLNLLQHQLGAMQTFLAERPAQAPVPDPAVVQFQLNVLAEGRAQATQNAETIHQLAVSSGQTQEALRFVAERQAQVPGVVPHHQAYVPPQRFKPDLPTYNGRADLTQWQRQVADTFLAYQTAPVDQFAWVKLALRDQAADFWHYECAEVPRDLPHLFEALRTRFRPHTFAYDASVAWKSLRMSHGNFHEYLRNFHDLRGRVQRLITAEELAENFVIGLTAEFQQEVKFHQADSLPSVIALCQRFAHSRTQSRPATVESRQGSRPHRRTTFSRARPGGAPRSRSRDSRTFGTSQTPSRSGSQTPSWQRRSSRPVTPQRNPAGYNPGQRRVSAESRTTSQRGVNNAKQAETSAPSPRPQSNAPRSHLEVPQRGARGRGYRASPRGNGGR